MIKIKNSIKKTLCLLLMGVISLTSIYFSANAVGATPNETKVVNISGNTSQNRTETITLPENATVNNVTTNTGNVTFTQNGTSVTVNLSGGTGVTTSEYKKYSWYNQWVTCCYSSYDGSFPDTYDSGYYIKNKVGSPWSETSSSGTVWFQHYEGWDYVTTYKWVDTTTYSYTVTIYYTAGFIKVTLPISLTANIDSNATEDINTSFSILNNSSSSINIAFSATASADTPAKVVEYDKFADWTSLNVADTTQNIALGIEKGINTNWLKAEGSGESLGITIGKDEESTVALKLLHGYAWDDNYTLNYIFSVRIALN